MRRRLRRARTGPPSRAGAAIGLALSAAFAVLGVLFVIPLNPPFGVVWTALAIAFVVASVVRLTRRHSARVNPIDHDAADDVAGR
jgi:hypothetical protein